MAGESADRVLPWGSQRDGKGPFSRGGVGSSLLCLSGQSPPYRARTGAPSARETPEAVCPQRLRRVAEPACPPGPSASSALHLPVPSPFTPGACVLVETRSLSSR